MEKKKLHINLTTILLIIAIVIIIIMGYFMYSLSDSKKKAENEIQLLKDKNQSMQTTLDTIQTYLNNTNNAQNSTDAISEKEKVEQVAKGFIKAVNEKDWSTVEKYSNVQIVNQIKEYNISNMNIDFSTLKQDDNNTSRYRCYCTYDMNYNGLTAKEVGLGKMFSLEKKEDTYVVITPFATGL